MQAGWDTSNRERETRMLGEARMHESLRYRNRDSHQERDADAAGNRFISEPTRIRRTMI